MSWCTHCTTECRRGSQLTRSVAWQVKTCRTACEKRFYQCDVTVRGASNDLALTLGFFSQIRLGAKVMQSELGLQFLPLLHCATLLFRSLSLIFIPFPTLSPPPILFSNSSLDLQFSCGRVKHALTSAVLPPCRSSVAVSSHGEPGVQCWAEDVPVCAVRTGVHRVRPGVHAVQRPLPARQGWLPETHGDIWSRLARWHGVQQVCVCNILTRYSEASVITQVMYLLYLWCSQSVQNNRGCNIMVAF